MVPKLLPDNLKKKGNLVKWILRCSVIIHFCSAAVLMFYQGTANKDAKGVEAVWDLIAPIVRSLDVSEWDNGRWSPPTACQAIELIL